MQVTGRWSHARIEELSEVATQQLQIAPRCCFSLHCVVRPEVAA